MESFYKTFNALSEGLCSRRSFLGGMAAGSLLGVGAFAGAQAFAAEGDAGKTQAAADGAGKAPVAADGGGQAKTAAAGGLDAKKARSLIQPYAAPSVVTDEERLASTKKVLVVVDYQVDFVDGGVFGTVEPAIAIEDGLCEVIQRYRDNDDIIIYTMDTHPSDHYLETREGTFNPPHCIPGTEGWELYGKVRDLLSPDNAIQVLKGTYGSADLPAVLQLLQSQGIGIELVEFAGVSTTCRVLHNAIIVYNFFPELPLVFDERTTASYTDEKTAEQLNQLEGWGFIVKRG